MSPEANRDFASVLNDILIESQLEDLAPAAGPSVTVDYLAVAEELLSGRIVVSDEVAAALYRETAEDMDASVDALFEAVADAAREEAAAPPAELPSAEPEAVSRELGLMGSTSLADLARLRRAFAFKNHPDRVAPHLRQRALVRMQVANMLIDDARRRAQAAPRS